MAPTTGHTTTIEADIEASPDGITWTDISGSLTSVTVPAQSRMTADTFTFGGDLPVVTHGPREAMDTVVNSLYTEVTGEAFETIRPWFQSGARCFFRYSPKGKGATNRAVYTASNDGVTPGGVVISNLKYPDINAGTADPATSSFTLRVPSWLRTVTGNSTGLGSA